MKSIAKKSLEFTSLFEAELLVGLLLWKWGHPLAGDEEFANTLLEEASIALREAMAGKQLIESVPASQLNFVAAVWYAEQCGIERVDESKMVESRRAWLSAVRRALPSCFCDPSDLPPS